MKVKNKMLVLIFSIFLLVDNDVSANDVSAKDNIAMLEEVNVINFGGSDIETFRSAVELSDGGIVAVGFSDSTDAGFENKGSTDAIIVKYDEDGSQEWIKSFGGSSYDYFYSVIETSDGGIVAVGDSASANVEFTNNGGYDAIMVKYDSQGNQLWVKNFGGSYSDSFNSVIEVSDKGIIAVGESYSTDAGFVNRGNYDAIMVKYDSEGNQQWVKNFGGLGDDYFKSVVEISDKGIISVGYSDSTDAGFTNKGSDDAIIVKYDSQGNQQWIKNFGGSSDDYFNSVIETSDKGIVAVGYSSSTNAGFNNKGGNDAIMVKYDSEGNQLWVKNFGGSNNDYFKSVIETSDKGIVAVGYSTSTNLGFINKGKNDAIIVKYDSNGNQQWIQSFGGLNGDAFYSIVEVSDGSLIVVGESRSEDAGFISNGYFDAIIVKYREKNLAEIAVENAMQTLELIDINYARSLVNQMSESNEKDKLNDILNSLFPNVSLELKRASSNLDVYIKSENVLILSLDTNSVTFEDFSGVEDIEKTNAINISINSSLPYQLNAYLPIEIQNSDKSNTMDKRILNIKENSEADYKEFANTTDKIVLKDNCPAGNNLVHGVDIKLKGGIAHKKDVYKTTIKFEAEQK